jgi:YfiH family protein
MSLFYGDTKDSLANRNNFLNSLGIDYKDLVCAKQIHESCAKYVTRNERGRGALSHDAAIEETDALITDKKNLPLAVFSADCLSVFLYDPLTPAIGLVHAGWRSSKENISLKTIKLMENQFNIKASGLFVGFGPAIRSCCCEVVKDFIDFFPKDVSDRDGRHYLDLVRVNKRQVLDSGVKETNITDLRICTACRNNEFFSYRREGKSCGRLMSVMMLK